MMMISCVEECRPRSVWVFNFSYREIITKVEKGEKLLVADLSVTCQL